MQEAFSIICVHRLLFGIAVASGLVSHFSHVHRHSVFLQLSTSSNPNVERKMDLTAFVTLCDEFMTHGTKFKLTLIFSVSQKPNEGPGQDRVSDYHYHFFANTSGPYSCLPTESESVPSVLRNVESCCR